MIKWFKELRIIDKERRASRTERDSVNCCVLESFWPWRWLGLLSSLTTWVQWPEHDTQARAHARYPHPQYIHQLLKKKYSLLRSSRVITCLCCSNTVPPQWQGAVVLRKMRESYEEINCLGIKHSKETWAPGRIFSHGAQKSSSHSVQCTADSWTMREAILGKLS